MTELVNEANIRGHRLEIHAIGDRALDVTLTALENAGVPPEKRPVIAHCQVKQRQYNAFRSPSNYIFLSFLSCLKTYQPNFSGIKILNMWCMKMT